MEIYQMPSAVITWFKTPEGTLYCAGDAKIIDGRARAALAGNWPYDDNSIRIVPLYDFYLVILYKIWGINHLVPLIIQMLLEIVACAAIYWIGKHVYSSLIGLLASLAMALYGPLIIYEICYAQIGLTVPLFVLMFYFLFKYYASNRSIFLFISGGMLGLCALSRPTMLIIAPLILSWFFFEKNPPNNLS